MFYYVRKYWKYALILLCALIVFLGVYLYYEDNNVTTSSIKKLNDPKDENKSDAKTVFVDIKGAVNTPGVYELEVGKRVIDVIKKAGGLTENANTININLSKKLTDEMYVVVYTKNEISEYKKNNGNVIDNSKITCASNECICPDVNNDACINKNDNTKSNSSSSKETDLKDAKISINNASKEELMSLSGIGDAKADAIIAYRQENGLFKSIEDIKNVSGIGDAIFEKIKNNITV